MVRILLISVVLLGISFNANARPFTSEQEIQYLRMELGQIAGQSGFQLVESSIIVEPSALNYVNPVYNISPFRLITGPTDDRAYSVYFKASKSSQTFEAKVHFRTTEHPYCAAENNTTVRERSAISGKENCLTLHISPWANDLGKQVTIDDLLSQ